jgi:tetratricopeptide (TPR) repeat protein
LSNDKPEPSRAAFERAVFHLQSGDAVAAERVCRDALRVDTSDANLHSLLGAALLRQNRAAEAEHSLGLAIARAPAFAGAYEGRAETRLAQGRVAEGLEDLMQARKLEPNRASVLLKLGRVCAALGDDEAACRALTELVALRPEDTGALHLLAGVLCRLKRLADAENLLGRVVSLDEKFTQGWMDLGLVQQRRDQLAEAERSFLRVTELEPGRADAQVALGTVLAVAGRHEDALSAFRHALKLDADNADALAGLGHVLKTIGDQDGAVAAYRRCIATHPDDGQAYWALADFKTFRFEDRDLANMRQQLATETLAPDQRVGMLFALGTALDQRRDFDAAFEYFRRGNELRHSRRRYDPRRTKQFHDELVEVFNPEFMAEHAGAGNPDPAPIFIVGMPRSGSTLVEQILASHSQVEGTHEMPELDRIARSTATGRGPAQLYPASVRNLSPEEFFNLGSQYLDLSRRHRDGYPRFTDKMPNNFVHVGLLALILPEARIIDVRRHPVDCCLSCYMQLFAHGQTFSYDLRDLGSYYLEYRRLVEHWHRILPGRVLELQYEALISDFDGQLRRLLGFCGLPWEESCLQFHETRRAVRSASSEQVRRPLYRDALDRWRNYEPFVGPLIEVLEPLLRTQSADSRPHRLGQ